MEKVTISKTYDVKYWISDNICLTKCNRVINVKKGIELKQFLRGSKKAVYINGVVNLIENLKPHERIFCPF